MLMVADGSRREKTKRGLRKEHWIQFLYVLNLFSSTLSHGPLFTSFSFVDGLSHETDSPFPPTCCTNKSTFFFSFPEANH